uniref:Uncharacterized protein n=1 Tax=Panagrolaimus superbus TaxID=310955 RepID=A0A914XWI8_9BILA
MTVSSTTDIESQRSLLCGCCRFGSKKRRLNEINEARLFQPSTSTVPLALNESVPQIVISTPSINGGKYLFANGIDTSRSSNEIYTTARTSRADDIQQYTSMTELVRNIREEAGFQDTPRQISSDVGTTVSELRIEGLPELTSNNREPSLPSPSKEFYFPEASSSANSVSINAPSTISQQKYRPSINRKLNDLTVNVYNTFWRFYGFIITAIALILERILPL